MIVVNDFSFADFVPDFFLDVSLFFQVKEPQQEL